MAATGQSARITTALTLDAAGMASRRVHPVTACRVPHEAATVSLRAGGTGRTGRWPATSSSPGWAIANLETALHGRALAEDLRIVVRLGR